jgi:hypothetical protein
MAASTLLQTEAISFRVQIEVAADSVWCKHYVGSCGGVCEGLQTLHARRTSDRCMHTERHEIFVGFVATLVQSSC